MKIFKNILLKTYENIQKHFAENFQNISLEKNKKYIEKKRKEKKIYMR